MEQPYLSLPREWFVAEWGKIDHIEDKPNGAPVLAPLLLIDDDTLIGGLDSKPIQWAKSQVQEAIQ